jgi:peptide/nickel transport system permease protein
LVVFTAICAPLLAHNDPNATDTYNKNQRPGEEFLLGTDYLGRDIWSRIVYGSRASLIIAVAAQSLTLAAGLVLGLICGFYPKADMIIMRVLEATSSLPTILTVFVIGSVLGEGYGNLILAMVIGGVSGTTRYSRAQIMSLRQKEFVEREVAMGASTARIMFLHVLPQCSSYILVSFGEGLAGKVMSLATLSFLGVGLPSSVPNWGAEISMAQGAFMIYPMNVVYPMIAIAITTFGFAMLGDGLRDFMDPKSRRRG